MIPTSPVCAKLASFFNYGGISGKELEQVPQRHVSVIRSFDKDSVGSLSLNCVSKMQAIKTSLFEQSANSSLSIASEEAVNTGGIIDEVILRRKSDIEIYEQSVSAMGIKNIVSQKSASLKNIICKDEVFILNLQEKVHRTALFVFDIEPDEDEVSALGCKEVRRLNVSPDKIICVIVPEKYKSEILGNGEAFKIPLAKVRFVGDTDGVLSLSYKDSEGNLPSCKMDRPIKVPDYETALIQISQELGDINTHPLFTHMTRLQE